MVVPRLSAQKELHESDATLDQSARDQAPRSVVTGFRLVQPVHRVGGFGLAGNVERLARRGLHAGGQLVTGDAGFQLGLAGMLFEVPFVEVTQECQVLPL